MITGCVISLLWYAKVLLFLKIIDYQDQKMSIKAGLVGLPNVGKSTLFNALTKSQVPAENYPFCTIDPHLAITEVPDKRLEDMATIYGSKKIIRASISFVDIAGLVKGASQGEGLGNQFLSHIREVDLILHVIRCFTSSMDEVNPLDHFDTIISELAIKDIEMIEKRQAKIATLHKAAQNKPAEKKALELEEALLKDILKAINSLSLSTIYTLMKNAPVEMIPLLTGKNFLIIANITEDDFAENAYEKNEHYQALIKHFGADRVIPVCARTEYELGLIDNQAEKKEMMEILGLERSGLDDIILKAYQELGLITFFTVGPKEAHAWPLRKGTKVRKAAGEIHSDLERGFICADVYNYKDIQIARSEQILKDTGKIRTEGQDYIVQDGDQLHIKFNV